MKHTEDHNLVAMNLVHDPIREVAQDPLSRAGGAAGAADTAKLATRRAASRMRATTRFAAVGLSCAMNSPISRSDLARHQSSGASCEAKSPPDFLHLGVRGDIASANRLPTSLHDPKLLIIEVGRVLLRLENSEEHVGDVVLVVLGEGPELRDGIVEALGHDPIVS